MTTLALTGLLALSACSAETGGETVELPSAGGGLDYQLGAPYPAPAGVTIVVRDSTAEPAGAGYDVCYVNGFQTQPADSEDWLTNHASLVLHDKKGEPVADPDWPDEYLLDTSTALKRSTILARVGSALSACAAAGFDAVEIDNLDSYTRSGERLTIEGNIALATAYADLAHRLGLAIAQKNGSADSARLREEVGFDFALTEQCAEFEECAAYTDVYGDLVFDVEYDADFLGAACEAVGAAVLRDRDLVGADDPAYVFQGC